MALNAFGLGFMFTAKDAASPVMGKVDKNFRQMDKSTDKAARRMKAAQGAMSVGMGMLAVGAVGLGASLKSALAAGEFEQGVAKVGAISGATAEELKQLSDKAIQAGLDTQFSPTEAIGGLGELAVRGLTAAESMGALDGALSLAAGGQISIAEASSTTASALKVFGLEADQATFAADKLLKISNVTALQAKDLELALGTVGRGASLAKQSIDEMLPSIGLVKNTGVDASVAASSVSSALIFMSKNAEKFKKLGVRLTDAKGAIRPFMDIVLDTRQAMSGMTSETKKVALATKMFGRFGITAFSAIGNQLEHGIRKPTGEIVKGAQAMEFLRETMKVAKGTAKAFADALLATLPGQITLLKGSLQTLAIELGRPMAEALKPATEAFKNFVNRVIAFVQSLSPKTRRLLGILLVATSAILAVGGAFLTVGAMAAIAAPAIATFAGAIASAAGPLALVGLAVVGLIGLFMVLRKAYEKNIGGFADFVGPMIDKVKLFFEGLFQFIEQGFFSGEVARRLDDPSNIGILKALTFLIGFGFRVKRFFKGLVAGFHAFMEEAEPVFHMMINALGKVEALFDDTADSANRALGPSEKWVKTGEKIGRVLGRVVSAIVGVAAIYISMWVGFIKGAVAAWGLLEPIVTRIVDSFSDIGDAIGDLLVDLGIMDPATQASTDAFETFGKVLGFIETFMVGPFLAAFSFVLQGVKFFVRILSGLIRGVIKTIGGIALIGEAVAAFFTGDWQRAWELAKEGFGKIWDGMKTMVMGVVDAIMEQVNDLFDFLADTASMLPAEMRPEWMERFIAARQTPQADAAIADMEAGLEERANARDRLALSAGVPVIPFANNIAGAAEAQAKAAPQGTSADAVKQGMLEAAAQLGTGKKGKQQINLVLDKQVVATANVDAKAENAALSFAGMAASEDG